MNATVVSPDSTRTERMDWWRKARLGMFIHYGLYSILGRGEWAMNRERIPLEEYKGLTGQFAPKADCAREWVETAKGMGAKYAVLTTRHHDGYCLWDSAITDFNAMRTGPKRDLVREFADACREAGMRVGFYYSLKDWSHPNWLSYQRGDMEGHDLFMTHIHGQVRELCANYGAVDVLWYDGPGPYQADGWRSEQLNAMVRELQPGILINNRSQVPEDFDTPEQHVKPSTAGRDWESCMTLNESWGWHSGDRDYKTPRHVIDLLARAAHAGGNLLLNIGPEPDGTVPPESRTILRQVGQWMSVNSEAIYATRRGPFLWSTYGFPTFNGKNIYAVMLRYPGKEMVFPGIGSPVKSATLLATGQSLQFRQQGDRLFISGMPEMPPDPLASVVRIAFDEEPKWMPSPF